VGGKREKSGRKWERVKGGVERGREEKNKYEKVGKIQEGAKGRVEIKKRVQRRGAEGGKEKKGEKVGMRECGGGVGQQVGGKK
jgi:hypothetical protein